MSELVNFYSPRNYQKTIDFLVISEGIENSNIKITNIRHENRLQSLEYIFRTLNNKKTSQLYLQTPFSLVPSRQLHVQS